MTVEEFEAALDLYGASIADWPQVQRMAAASVLAGWPEARTMLAAAREVDLLLAKTRAGPTNGSNFVVPDRIVAFATAQPQQRIAAPALRVPRAGWRYAACVAVALTGFALGMADAIRQTAPFEPILRLAFGPVDPFDAL
jgi:hypothetical protein